MPIRATLSYEGKTYEFVDDAATPDNLEDARDSWTNDNLECDCNRAHLIDYYLGVDLCPGKERFPCGTEITLDRLIWTDDEDGFEYEVFNGAIAAEWEARERLRQVGLIVS